MNFRRNMFLLWKIESVVTINVKLKNKNKQASRQETKMGKNVNIMSCCVAHSRKQGLVIQPKYLYTNPSPPRRWFFLPFFALPTSTTTTMVLIMSSGRNKAHGKGTKVAENMRYLARRKRLMWVFPSPLRHAETAVFIRNCLLVSYKSFKFLLYLNWLEIIWANS